MMTIGDVMTHKAERATRPLYIIAADIQANWPRPYFGAVPYLRALHTLDRITENYGADSAVSIVSYFLANASTWRGEHARRIKAELKAILPTRYR